MRNDRLGLLLCGAAGLLAGCAPPGSKVRLESYKDPYFPAEYKLTVYGAAYQRSADGDIHVLARGSLIEPSLESGTSLQFLHIHLFWKPHPGRTFDDPSCVDATLQYVLVSPAGTTVYEGAGFVYPKKSLWDGSITAQIENAALRPALQSGEAPEPLGELHLTGELAARNDPAQAVNLRREIELQLGQADRSGLRPARDD